MSMVLSCCYGLAISAFISLPATIRLRRMIRVDTFTVMLSKKIQKWIGILCNVIILGFSGLCVKGSLDLIAVTVKTGQRSPHHAQRRWPLVSSGHAVCLPVCRHALHGCLTAAMTILSAQTWWEQSQRKTSLPIPAYTAPCWATVALVLPPPFLAVRQRPLPRR